MRDDIERRVAEKSLNESGYNAKMKIATITQKLLVSPRVTQQEMDMIQHDLNCAAIASIESRGSTSNISIEALVLNTDRKSVV